MAYNSVRVALSGSPDLPPAACMAYNPVRVALSGAPGLSPAGWHISQYHAPSNAGVERHAAGPGLPRLVRTAYQPPLSGGWVTCCRVRAAVSGMPHLVGTAFHPPALGVWRHVAGLELPCRACTAFHPPALGGVETCCWVTAAISGMHSIPPSNAGEWGDMLPDQGCHLWRAQRTNLHWWWGEKYIA